jgi:hypothetical protein
MVDRSSVNIADRGAAYRKGGGRQLDPKSKPLTADEIRPVRLAHTSSTRTAAARPEPTPVVSPRIQAWLERKAEGVTFAEKEKAAAQADRERARSQRPRSPLHCPAPATSRRDGPIIVSALRLLGKRKARRPTAAQRNPARSPTAAQRVPSGVRLRLGAALLSRSAPDPARPCVALSKPGPTYVHPPAVESHREASPIRRAPLEAFSHPIAEPESFRITSQRET